MGRLMAFAVPLLATAVLGFAPGVASACSCGAPLDSGFLYPPPGSGGVSPDARIWIDAEAVRCDGFDPCSPDATTPAVRLFRSGVRVDGRLGLLRSGTSRLVVLSPARRLPVGSGYELRDVADRVVSTFTVAELVPHDPPSPPRLVGFDPVVEDDDPSSSCEPAYGFDLRIAPTGLFVVLDVAGASRLSADGPAGTVSGISEKGHFLLGEGGCLFDWPDAGPGASTQVRFGSFDPDGTFSGWSDWTFLQVAPAGSSGAGDEPAGSSGCSTTSSDPFAGILVLTLACAASLRRRTMTRLSPLVAVLVVCLVCCAEPPGPGDDVDGTDEIDAGVGCTPRSADLAGFLRSCTDSTDCAKVYVPSCTCDCAAVALDHRETQRYLDENRVCCPYADGTCGACFDGMEAVCRDGTCELARVR